MVVAMHKCDNPLACSKQVLERSPKGERYLGHTLFGHWHTTPRLFVPCAFKGQLVPLVLDGPINGTAFIAWVKQRLGPRLVAGDIVVRGNLSSHKVTDVRAVWL